MRKRTQGVTRKACRRPAMSCVRPEDKTFSRLKMNIGKNSAANEASAMFDQIKNSRDRSSCQEVHPVVADKKACRRMNLLNSEVAYSSRYEFLILTKIWNTKNNLVLLFEGLFPTFHGISVLLSYSPRPFATQCTSLSSAGEYRSHT